MSYNILVPLDGSRLSERVFDLLYLLAKSVPDIRVQLIRCFEPPSTVYLVPELAVPTSHGLGDNQLGEMILEYLRNKENQLSDLDVSTRMLVGDPAGEILEASKDSDLILMASHGRGGLGRWLLGGVATKVTRGSTVPVFVMRGQGLEVEPSEVKLERIVVPMDGSPASERALATAAKLAKRVGAQVLIYQGVLQVPMVHQQVMEANHKEMLHAQEYLRQQADSLEGVEVVATVREAHSRTGIIRFAEEQKADLIIMGSHGKTGMVRWMTGSETERVLHEAHCSVMVTH